MVTVGVLAGENSHITRQEVSREACGQSHVSY